MAALIRERGESISSQDRIDFVKAMAISRPKSRGHDPNSKIRIEEFYNNNPAPDQVLVSMANWAQFCDKLLNIIEDSWGAAILEEHFMVDGDAIQYADVILALSKCSIPNKTLRYFVTNSAADGFREGIADCLWKLYLSGRTLDSHTDLMVITSVISGQWDWDNIAKKFLEPLTMHTDEQTFLGCLEGALGLAITETSQSAKEFLVRRVRAQCTETYRFLRGETYQSIRVGLSHPDKNALSRKSYSEF